MEAHEIVPRLRRSLGLQPEGNGKALRRAAAKRCIAVAKPKRVLCRGAECVVCPQCACGITRAGTNALFLEYELGRPSSFVHARIVKRAVLDLVEVEVVKE